jgi:hypothetical protein
VASALVLLPQEEPEASRVLESAFAEERIGVRTGNRVASVERNAEDRPLRAG